MGQKRKHDVKEGSESKHCKKCLMEFTTSHYDDDILKIQEQVIELIDTNEKCTNKINEMIIKINDLITENNKLNDTIKILLENNEIFKKKIQLFETKIYNKEVKTLVNKYTIAIQDYNRLCNIESKIDKNAYQSLLDLKANRHLECHYLNIKFSKKDINDRLYVMRDEITNMPENIKNIFDTKYPSLIDSVKKLLNNQKKDVPSKNSLDIIKEWWDEI